MDMWAQGSQGLARRRDGPDDVWEYDTNNDGALDLLRMDTDHDGQVDYRAVNHDTGHTIPNYGN